MCDWPLPLCASRHQITCETNNLSCTSAQINPIPGANRNPHRNPNPSKTVWGARGRHEIGRGSPAIHAWLMNFACASTENCPRTGEYSWGALIPLRPSSALGGSQQTFLWNKNGNQPSKATPIVQKTWPDFGQMVDRAHKLLITS